MGLRVATNVASMGAQNSLKRINEQLKNNYQRLASGNRLINVGDDPAGLAISETLRADIRSMAQAERNTMDGLSFVQVAEGGLTEISNILIRLRELGIQAASDTVSEREREYINEEATHLVEEMNRVVTMTEFNGVSLLTGEEDQLEFQVGIDNKEEHRIIFDPDDFNATPDQLGVDGLDFSDKDDARSALDDVDEALTKLFFIRTTGGAIHNKLQTTARHLQLTRENLSEARSRITDADLAYETSELVKNTVLKSTGVAVLTQANNDVSQALRLIS